MGNKDKYGYQHNDGHYSKMTGNDKNSCYSIYDKNPSEDNHSAIHINVNPETKSGTIVEHGPNGKSTPTDYSCYLTTACMRHFQEKFDDNCYELTVLRWFRDNYVDNKDVEYYYEVAPLIVKKINNDESSNIIYDYIYDNVVDYCVNQIENGNYIGAYERYKNSVECLEKQYIKDLPRKKIIRLLKKTC